MLNVIIGVSVSAAVILALNAAVGAWALRAGGRAARLSAESPNAIVIESGRFGGLQRFLTTAGAIDPVTYIAVSLDRTGFTFWRDYSPTRVLRRVDATSASSVSVEEFVQGNRLRLRLRIVTPDGDICVPVLGRGLVRLMSPPRASRS